MEGWRGGGSGRGSGRENIRVSEERRKDHLLKRSTRSVERV